MKRTSVAAAVVFGVALLANGQAAQPGPDPLGAASDTPASVSETKPDVAQSGAAGEQASETPDEDAGRTVPATTGEQPAKKEDPSKGSDWPNFLGPNYNGMSPEKGLLREWPKEGPKVLWRIGIMPGWSCPSVSGNDLILAMSEFDPKSKGYAVQAEHIVCYEAATGKERWKYSYPNSYNNCTVSWVSGGVRATPAITDKRVYSIDPRGNIKCLDRKTGRLLWGKALDPEFYVRPGVEWKGYNNSPMIIDNVLVLNGSAGGYATGKGKGEHFIWSLGLDAATGKQLWMNEDKERAPYAKCTDGGSTAIPITMSKTACQVVAYNTYLHVIRARDGKELLRFPMIPPDAVALAMGSTLCVFGNKVVCNPVAGYMRCVELNLNSPGAKMAWVSPDHYESGDYHNYVEYKGHLYGVDAYNTVASDLKAGKLNFECLDAGSGKRTWKEGCVMNGYSYTAADGLMFLRSYQTLMLVELDPAKFKLKGKVEKIHSLPVPNMLDSRGLGDCVMPVLSRGRLFVRCPTEIICYDAKGTGANRAK